MGFQNMIFSCALQVGDQASTLVYLVEGRACMDATFIRPDVQRAIEFPIQLLTMGLEWWALSYHCMA